MLIKKQEADEDRKFHLFLDALWSDSEDKRSSVWRDSELRHVFLFANLCTSTGTVLIYLYVWPVKHNLLKQSLDTLHSRSNRNPDTFKIYVWAAASRRNISALSGCFSQLGRCNVVLSCFIKVSTLFLDDSTNIPYRWNENTSVCECVNVVKVWWRPVWKLNTSEGHRCALKRKLKLCSCWSEWLLGLLGC